MISPQDVYNFLSANISDDIMLDDSGALDVSLVQAYINDAYSELTPLKPYTDDNAVLDVYAKVLSSVSLLDRVGIPRDSFSGLSKRAKEIRDLINEVILNKRIKPSISSKLSVSENDINIISDDFIARFLK